MGRRVADHIAEAAGFYLDDVCAHVTEEHAAERAGEKIAKLKNPDSRQRTRHGALS
jgi:hypothetical protein